MLETVIDHEKKIGTGMELLGKEKTRNRVSIIPEKNLHCGIGMIQKFFCRVEFQEISR